MEALIRAATDDRTAAQRLLEDKLRIGCQTEFGEWEFDRVLMHPVRIEIHDDDNDIGPIR